MVTQENFNTVLEASVTAPVILAAISPSRAPETVAFGQDVIDVVAEYDGRFLAAVVDIDKSPAIAQALQLRQIPETFVLSGGRPIAEPFPGVFTAEELRVLLQQIGQQLTASGISGRHAPQQVVAEDGEVAADPRYAAAQDALGAGDIDLAVTEYQKLVDANPADAEAAAGLAMAKLLQRVGSADLTAARAAAAANPDDVAAQTMVADLDLAGGHVEDSFNRLIGLVARTSGDERNAAREHLVGLFAAVGNSDPRVTAARRALANALF
jgi:putative thioredoxin